MAEDQVPGTLVPVSFLPAIGLVHVQYSMMELEFHHAFWHLLGAGAEAGMAVTSTILNARTRVELFRHIVQIKVGNESDQDKLLKLATAFDDAAAERNRLVHDQPYVWSPSNQELSFIRSDAWLKPRPMKRFTKQALEDLAMRMFKIAARFQQYRINNPRWHDDEQFP